MRWAVPPAAAINRRAPPLLDSGGEGADTLDFDAHRITGFEEFVAGEPDARRRAGENDIARIKRHPTRELCDLFRHREDHLAGAGILFDDVVDPEFKREILRVG